MTSNTAVTLTHWYGGGPNNAYNGNENCLEINYNKLWNDAECRDQKKYICEMENE